MIARCKCLPERVNSWQLFERNSMGYRILAGITAVIHFAFIVFVLVGGLLLYRWPGVAWLHLLCAIYAVLIMVVHWRCPLTDMEIWLRKKAGEKVNWTEFIQYYLFSRVGLRGSEWFVTVALVVVIVCVNWHPYQTFFN